MRVRDGRLRAILWLGVAIWIAACRPPAPEPQVETQSAPVATRQAAVDWERALQHASFDDSLLTDEQRSRLSNVLVPLLLPNEVTIDAATIIGEESWYAASMRYDEHAVAINGSTTLLDSSGETPPPVQELGGDDLTVSRSEGITELIFRAYGAVYTISVECTDSESDLHCAEDDYVLGLANGLQLSRVNRL